ncbi:MAG: V-type ATP synthase subunit A [Gammaproteobacteria bacterium]|jgi:V/A-type H+-transporting ATPase subunit A|nr:MAG: V-type ATP synthase subunit A [Gammaproteobacteria bacterium]
MSESLSPEKPAAASAAGKVEKAFGNLLQVRFAGRVRQGEVAFVKVGDRKLKAEVIEIAGALAKLQVFEDTRGVDFNTEVELTGDLLEAELGPGLLTSIVDGLQNPLEEVAKLSGYFLPTGVYIAPLDRERKWDYIPVAAVGASLKRGDTVGTTSEGRFTHRIMVPFALYGVYRITWTAPRGFYNVDQIVAKAVDPAGREHAFTMTQKWPIKNSLAQGEKIKPTKMMGTGVRIVDTQFPLIKGGTFCTPGPFGAGKTVLQHHLSKYSSVDIVVVVACGERAGEVVEVLREFPHLTDPYTGESLMNRTVIVCNTSSMPVAARESSIYLGITIAEYYRQMGLDVLLLADSTSRWAQALREMSGRLEEIPGDEAFPAYLGSRIAEFYERSGVIALADGAQGSITIGGAVSPAGGNFEEPVTQATLAVVGAFLGLSRERSDSRRYPAIDPLISWSKYVDTIGHELDHQIPEWSAMVKRANKFLLQGNEIGRRMEVVGEEGTSMDDMQIYLKAELYDFSYLQQNAFDKEDAYCPLERQMLLFKLINKIFDKKFKFTSHDEARGFFLNLQNQIKNMNFMPFNSEMYRNAHRIIEESVELR